MALMRIAWGKVPPGGWDLFFEEFNRVVDASLPGLIKRTLARDRSDSDSFYIVAWWETEAAMNDPRARRLMASLKPFLLGEYVGSVCDIVYEV